MSSDFRTMTSGPIDKAEVVAWIIGASDELCAKGATWLRTTHHPDNPGLILMEGWKVRPDNEPPADWSPPA
jgi:hypothetical protein